MSTKLSKNANRLSWALQAVAAVILAQTLFFKFTGAPESRAIFETLGAEPWGRLGSGLVELLAVTLLLTPSRAALGGLLASGVMVGALGAHLTRLGIVVNDDGGTLFAMALITLFSAATVAWLRRGDLPGLAVREEGAPRPQIHG